MNQHSTRTVADRTAAGAAWLISARLFTRGLDLVTLSVLGRLLAPADFGLVSIAMTLILIVEAILELPVIQGLIRLPVLTPSLFHTAFTLSFIRGAGLALILFLAAWPFAAFYGDPRLVGLICTLAVAPAARGLLSPKLANFAKALDFRREFAMELAGKCVSLTLAISLAWWTRSYWAIAAGTVAAPVTMAVLSYILAPYSPRLSLTEWRAFAGFVGWNTASQAVTALNWQMDQLLVGKFVTRMQLGQFSMGSTLALLPFQVLVVQMIRPFVAAFALIKDDRRRLADAYLTSMSMTVALGAPIMLGLSSLALPIVTLVVGKQWTHAAPMLQWQAIAVIPMLFYAPLSALAMALGQTKIFLRLSVIECCIKLPLTLVVVMRYGVNGALVTRVVCTVIMAFFAMEIAKKMLDLPVRRQIIGQWRPACSGALMLLALWPLRAWLASIDRGLLLPVCLGITVGIGASVYGAAMIVLWRISGSPEGFETKVASVVGAMAVRLRPTWSH